MFKYLFLIFLFASLLFSLEAVYPPQGGQNLNRGLQALANSVKVQMEMEKEVNEEGKQELNKATEELLKVAGGGKIPMLEMKDPNNPSQRIIFEFDKDTGHLIEVVYKPSKTTVEETPLTPQKVNLNEENPAKFWAKLFASVIYLFGTGVILIEAFISFASRSYVWGFFYLFVGTIASSIMYEIYKLL